MSALQAYAARVRTETKDGESIELWLGTPATRMIAATLARAALFDSPAAAAAAVAAHNRELVLVVPVVALADVA